MHILYISLCIILHAIPSTKLGRRGGTRVEVFAFCCVGLPARALRARHGSEGGSRHQHHGGKTGCGGGLQDRLQRTTFVLGHVIYLHLFI